MQQLLLGEQQTRGHIQITVIGQNAQEEDWRVVYSCFIHSISEANVTTIHLHHFLLPSALYALYKFTTFFQFNLHSANVMLTVYTNAA